MKLIFAMPTYGPIDPQVSSNTINAIMHAAKFGHTWMGVAAPDRLPYAVARNKAVEAIVHNDDFAEAAIFWMDSDIVLPIDSITRLANSGKDFITGIYFQRAAEHRPLVAHYDEKMDSFIWLAKWPKNVIAPIDGCGFGCVLTSVKMLRDMEAPWFEYKKFSEDFTFCRNAAKAGYQLYVDTGVLCGHLMDPVPATIETYANKYPEFKLEVVNNAIRSRFSKESDLLAENQPARQARRDVLQSPAV
jgi:hypothetical protein